MQYWVISPNVWNGSNEAEWKERICKEQIVAMGWSKDENSGIPFSQSMKKNDIILVAQGANRNKRLYMAGIIASDVMTDENEGYQWRQCEKTLTKDELESLNLPFTEACAYGATNQIPALYKLKVDNPNDKKIIDLIINKIKEKYTMRKTLVEHLKVQKNIILTGAPGTGKTYLARQIAKELTKTGERDPLKLLEEYYDRNKDWLEKENQDCEDLRQQFIETFPLENIENITLDEYCIGDDAKDNFCYWIERKLRKLGSFFPGGSGAYIIYKPSDKSKGDYINQSGLNNENTMQLLGKAIKEIGETGKLNNNKIGNKNIDNSFIIKIANSYKSDFYFPVMSNLKLENICDIFGIQKDRNSSLQTNRNIKEYFENKFPKISMWIIVHIIFTLFYDKDEKKLINNIENQDILLNDKGIKFTQFHTSYDYTDFVEGLRPVQKENGDIGFELKDGIFKELCIEATKFSSNKFVMIIDEINRAELSKVFGELFFSIEAGYRGKEHKVQLQYSNLYKKDTESENYDPFKDGFYVPENVYIIATMNDIDRSIEPFDFAMKRRFAWHEISFEDSYEAMWQGKIWFQDAKKKIYALNKAIANEFSTAYQIGGSYFLKLDDLNHNFEDLWKYHIEVVLKDYLRGSSNAVIKLEELKKYYDNPDNFNNSNDISTDN